MFDELVGNDRWAEINLKQLPVGLTMLFNLYNKPSTSATVVQGIVNKTDKYNTKLINRFKEKVIQEEINAV